MHLLYLFIKLWVECAFSLFLYDLLNVSRKLALALSVLYLSTPEGLPTHVIWEKQWHASLKNKMHHLIVVAKLHV